MHVLPVVAPGVVEYLPGAQDKQVVIDDEPSSPEYFPSRHNTQASKRSLPCVSRYVPDGQFKHVVPDGEPSTSEYLPALHKIQSVS